MLSKTEYKYNGSLKYQISFPYINKEDIFVTVDNEPAEFTFLSKSIISLKTSPTGTPTVQIKRKTNIDNIKYLYENKEIFDADNVNVIKLQLIYSLQEISETELDSLQINKEEPFFINLDMNNNQVINLMNSENDLDAFTLREALDLIGLEEEAGFSIGDTIISARTDQHLIEVGGVQKWIPRDIEQQLLKTDYPELSNIYPETPGGVNGYSDLLEFTNTGTIIQFLVDKNNYGGFFTISANNDIKYFFKNNTPVIVGNAGFSNTTGAFKYLSGNEDLSVMVANSPYTEDGRIMKYSLNQGVTWSNCSFSGETLPTSGWTSIAYANGLFFVADANVTKFAYSTDGINWTVKLASTIFDISKAQSVSNARINSYVINNFYYHDGKYYWYSFTTSTNQKYVLYEIQPDFNSSVIVTEVSSTEGNYITVRPDGRALSSDFTTNSLIRTSNDYMNNFSIIDLGVVVNDSIAEVCRFGIIYSKADDSFIVPLVNEVTNKLYIVKLSGDFLDVNLISTFNIDPSFSSLDRFNCNLFYDNDNFFSTVNQPAELVTLLKPVIGSNLTFDMPVIEAPSEGITTQHKYYTKGK